MTYGAAIFLIAVGAILRFAVTTSVAGIDIAVVGLILMIAGLIGLAVSLFYSLNGRTARSTTAVSSPLGERITETRQTIR